MPQIHIVLVCYALDIRPMIPALEAPNVWFHVFTHSRRPAAADFVSYYDMHPNMIIHDYGVNRGLAQSWNDGIIESYERGADAVLVVNDDVTMSREDMLILANAAVEHREAGIIEAEGFNERMNEHQILQFAVFGINPIALDTIGYFDQNFAPIYFEDSDYSRRAALAGLIYHNAGETSMVHRGSATIGSVPELNQQNHMTFSLCNAYYRRKWGGEPGQEIFRHPFNDTRVGLKIHADHRFAPYQGYNRIDLHEVVKL